MRPSRHTSSGSGWGTSCGWHASAPSQIAPHARSAAEKRTQCRRRRASLITAIGSRRLQETCEGSFLKEMVLRRADVT
jgi:hypothetical protein